MIARIDGQGLTPQRIASKFAWECLGEQRRISEASFHGEWLWPGFAGTFMLAEGNAVYGLRWFKRRARIWACYTLSEVFIRVGTRHAVRGLQPDWRGETIEERVSYMDGYVACIPRRTPSKDRQLLETNIYTKIESLLYEGA